MVLIFFITYGHRAPPYYAQTAVESFNVNFRLVFRLTSSRDISA